MHHRAIIAFALIACLAGPAFAGQDPDSPIAGTWNIVGMYTFGYDGSVSKTESAIGSFAFDPLGKGVVNDEGAATSLSIRWDFDRASGRFILSAEDVTLSGYAQISGSLLVVILESPDSGKAMFILEKAK